MPKFGRPLNQVELDSYDLVDRELAKKVRVFRTVRVPGPFHGLCLVNWIFFTCDVADDGRSTLLAHELVHVRQWHQRGIAGYLRWYLRCFAVCLKKRHNWMSAYRDIEAEIEANREAQSWWQRRSAVECTGPT